MGAAAHPRRLARESVLRVVSLVGGVVIAALGVVLAVDGAPGLYAAKANPASSAGRSGSAAWKSS